MKPKTIWLYYWTAISNPAWGEFVRVTYSTKRKTFAQITAYDRENGWKISKVKRLKVPHPGHVIS